MKTKTFDELLFEGALTAIRTLSLTELYKQRELLDELNVSPEILEFPWLLLDTAIREKEMN